jgi:hypothetical protein
VPIEAAVSRPTIGDGRLPIVILVGGFDTGRRSVECIPDPGANIVMGYSYPGRDFLRAPGATIHRLVAAQRGAHRVPGQIASLGVWAAAQPWADRQRIVLVGVSLGALLAPAIARAMVTAGVSPTAVVLADGGANLTLLVKHNLRGIPSRWRPPLAWTIGTLLRRLEPARHLPHLKGAALLLIHATTDSFIPSEAAAVMDRLTPDPKTIVTLAGGHRLPGDAAGVDALSSTVLGWLTGTGAINGSTC